MKVEVVAILPGSLAVIDVRGLRRVLVRKTGEPLEELMLPDHAAQFAAGFNLLPGDRAVVRRYRPPRAASTA